MSFRQPISDEQLAPFLEAAKSMTIPADEVKPLEVEEIPAPSASQNPKILEMNQALIAEAIRLNAEHAKEYEERKELWYRETAIAAYLAAKRKADEAEAKRKAEEAAAKRAAEEENERAMDANSEGEDEVDPDETPKSKSKSKSKKTKSRSIVDSESEEETEEVKAKRRKAKGKGKAVDTEVSNEVTS
jgi:Tfp pilus assembly protein PilV